MKSSINKIAAFAAALFFSLGFAACCLLVPQISSVISSKGNINLLVYAGSVLLFCCSFMLFCAILNKTAVLSDSKSFWMPVLSLLLIFGTIIFLFITIALEGNIYGGVTDRFVWHKLPFWLVILFLTAEFFIFLSSIRNSTIRIPNTALYLFYAAMTILIGYTHYTPAVFLRNASDRLHMDAYFNSIYNVLHGSPYSEFVTSIYGHYGILYKLPLEILGGDFIDFILINSILGACSFLAVFLALHLMVKSNLFRILGCISITMPYLSMRGGFYWQLWPHRILFMSLLIGFGAFCVHFKKVNRITVVLGYILCMLGILWNTETGIFCAVAWAGFWILRKLSQKKCGIIQTIGICLLHIAAVILCFTGAYVIVGLYNIKNDGVFNTLEEFLFPLLTTSYMTDLLRVDLPLFPSAYMPALALFLLGVAFSLSHIKWFSKHEADDNVIIPSYVFLISILALGQLTYFVNRASYHNLDICHFPAILLLCIMAEKGIHTLKNFCWQNRNTYAASELLKGSFTAVALAVLMALTTGTVVQYGYNTDIKTQFHNKQDIHDFAAHIAANIPENTYAFGIGVPEIYAMLRWDTQCYTLDFADISVYPPAADHVIEDIKAKDVPAFLVGENTMKKLRNFSSDGNAWIKANYHLEQKFEFQGAVFKYYVKNES